MNAKFLASFVVLVLLAPIATADLIVLPPHSHQDSPVTTFAHDPLLMQQYRGEVKRSARRTTRGSVEPSLIVVHRDSHYRMVTTREPNSRDRADRCIPESNTTCLPIDDVDLVAAEG